MRNKLITSGDGIGPKIIKIGTDCLDRLQNEATSSERGRTIYGLEIKTPEGLVKKLIGEDADNQLMINTLNPGTYVQPHAHEHKLELFLILRGKIKIISFTSEGIVSDISYLESGKEFIALTEKGVYHTAVPMVEGTQIFEFKPGKYDGKTDKVSPTWAPAEKSENSAEYVKWLAICEIGDNALNYREHLEAKNTLQMTIAEKVSALSQAYSESKAITPEATPTDTEEPAIAESFWTSFSASLSKMLPFMAGCLSPQAEEREVLPVTSGPGLFHSASNNRAPIFSITINANIVNFNNNPA